MRLFTQPHCWLETKCTSTSSRQATLLKWETSSMSSFISFFQSKRRRPSNRQLQHEDLKVQPVSPPAPCHHQDETSIDNTSITSKCKRSLNNKNKKIGKTRLSEASSYYSNCLLFPNWSPFVISPFLSFEDNLNSKDECSYDTIVWIMYSSQLYFDHLAHLILKGTCHSLGW